MAKLVIPDFASESEEAQWWFDNQDVLDDMFLAAAAEGRLSQGTVARRMGLPTPHIELTPGDFELAKQKAAQQGVQFYDYVNSLIHSALTTKASV